MSNYSIPATAAFHTLGCKLNFAETSTIASLLSQKGIRRAAEGERPDLIVVNTCSVTAVADKKGRSLIRRLTAKWPDATVVVTGCYAQLKPEEVGAIEGVDIVLGSAEKLKIAEYIDLWLLSRAPLSAVTPSKDIREFSPGCERGDRTRYFLKVQDGCDYFCSYCTIPFARGRSRSGSIASIVEQARGVAREGGKEIVLTGVNVGDFGKGSDETFFSLIRALDAVEGIERYRISSIEPNLLAPEIIEWVARESRAFMPHFHIPLQSGSDAVLKLMGRRYDTSLFRSRIELIKELIPDAFIGVDVIAGARGESEEEWRKGYDFIASLPITQLHVFPYSERPGTRALALDGVVSQEIKHRRVAELTALGNSRHAAFMQGAIGSARPVLWEQPHSDDAPMHGFTDNYIRVEAPYNPSLINCISQVTLLPGTEESLKASF